MGFALPPRFLTFACWRRLCYTFNEISGETIPKEVAAVSIWAYYLSTFTDSLFGHIALVLYLLVIMDERGWGWLKKLPALLPSPALAALAAVGQHYGAVSSPAGHYIHSFVIILTCSLWAGWVWRAGFWRAFAAVCLGGVFQVALTCLSRILLNLPVSNESRWDAVVLAIYFAMALCAAALLRRLRFGAWFRLLLEDAPDRRRIALLLFALETAMEVFFLLQPGIAPGYLAAYYLLVVVLALLTAGLVIYLAQRLDAAQKVEAQRNVIAQQQLYERDLEAIRQEVRAFRHDYKNLLAEQAGKGELDALRAALSELDAGFDQRIGDKIRACAQLGNVRVPPVRSLLLSKLAAMAQKGVGCRLEVLYPVEQAGMDVWDLARCLGILLDNAAEAALDTAAPWVEVILLAQGAGLSLQVSNPYANAIDPGRLWEEGFSTKGAGRGLGLPSLQRILASYPNASCSTSWANGVFIQKLAVEAKA